MKIAMKLIWFVSTIKLRYTNNQALDELFEICLVESDLFSTIRTDFFSANWNETGENSREFAYDFKFCVSTIFIVSFTD